MAAFVKSLFVAACALTAYAIDPRAYASFVINGMRGLETLGKAWEKWSANSGSKEWPSIRIEIVEPSIGVKITPPGLHPKKFLEQLPELHSYIISDAVITYDFKGDQIEVTCEGDWHAFFSHLDEERRPTLSLRFLTPITSTSSLWARSRRAIQAASEKLRSFGKSLIMGETVEVAEVTKEEDFLKQRGFTHFASNQLLYEELGYDKETWPDVVDNLVDAGIPSVWGKALKLAAKARRGSIKSLATSSYDNGVRTMFYMKFQVLPDGEGGVDGLFAIYQLNATSPAEMTTLEVEQSFKRFVELDAHQKWKKEVRQLLPPDGADQKKPKRQDL